MRRLRLPALALALALALLAPAGRARAQQTPASVTEAFRAAQVARTTTAFADRWRRRQVAAPGDRLARFALALEAAGAYRVAEASAALDSLAAGEDAVARHAALQLGLLHTGAGRFREAADALERAHTLGRAARDAPFLVEVRLHQAVPAGRLAGGDSALALLDALEPAARRAPPRLRRLWTCQRVLALARLGRAGYEVAARDGARAAEAAGDGRAAAGCWMALGQYHERRGWIFTGIEALRRAADHHRRVGNLAGLASVQQWRGYMHRSVAAYGEARKDLREAIRAGEASGNLAATGWSRLNLALIALALGDASGVAREVPLARRDLVATGDRWALVTLRGIEGRALARAGRYPQATAILSAASDSALAIGSPLEAMGLQRELAYVALAQGELDRAARHLAVTDSLARQLGVPGAEVDGTYDAGILALARGDLDGARRAFEAYLEQRGRTPSPQLLFDAKMGLADVLLRTGAIDSGVALMREAGAALEAWRGTLDARDLRIAAAQARRLDLDPDHRLGALLGRLVRAGRADAAFQLAEARRARTLVESLARRGILPRRLAGAGAPLPSAEVARSLPDSTALVVFVTARGPEPTLAFTVSRAGMVVELLPPADSVARDIERFSALLLAGERAPVLARRLATQVLPRSVRTLPSTITHLAIVADGPLLQVPFDALQLPDGAALVERAAVSLVPSVRVALAAWAAPPRPHRGTLIVGDAAFEATALDLGEPLARLPGSGREARAVAALRPGAGLLTGAAATEAAVRRAARGGLGLLHLATHALVDDRSIEGSGLALAPGGGEDGFLSGAELATLDLRDALVVLSACRSARGMAVAEEGVQGIAGPLLEAGARGVVATQWPVGDDAVVPLVERFYQGMGRGWTAERALREAKLEALRRGAPPRDWAAFTVLGDARVAADAGGRPGRGGR